MSRKELILDKVTVLGKAGDGRSSGDKRLDAVSCAIPSGRLTLLVGAIGSGKSTLLDVMGGLVRPDAGEVREQAAEPGGEDPLDAAKGYNATGDRVDERKGIGMMFQFPEGQLFARTVQGEFDYSLRPLKLTPQQAAAQTAAALRETGLAGGTLALHPFSLSGGEQRRIAMATTLATAPGWLLLDEASAGLDAEGLRRFAQQLRRWTRQDGVGIVLATHDLGTFLPLADEVLVLVRGRLAAAMSREQVLAAPAVLRQAGLALPDRVRAAAWLRARGAAPPAAAPAAGEEAGDTMSPGRFAEAVSRALAARVVRAAAAPPRELPERLATASALSVAGTSPAPSALSEDPASTAPPARPAAQATEPIDPRAAWLFITLASFGMLLQTSWLGLAASAAIAAAAVASTRVPFRAIVKAVLPFVGLMSFTVVFSGLHLKGFSIADALVTLRAMLRFLFIMAVGFLLPLQYSPLTLKRTLERSLSPLSRIKLPVEAISLYVAMLMRFIPQIRAEWGRFSRIARARGGSRSKPGKVRFRDLPAITVPMLISLLRLADATASAMEMRGYKLNGNSLAPNGVPPGSQGFTRRDYIHISIGAIAFLMLCGIRIME